MKHARINRLRKSTSPNNYDMISRYNSISAKIDVIRQQLEYHLKDNSFNQRSFLDVLRFYQSYFNLQSKIGNLDTNSISDELANSISGEIAVMIKELAQHIETLLYKGRETLLYKHLNNEYKARHDAISNYTMDKTQSNTDKNTPIPNKAILNNNAQKFEGTVNSDNRQKIYELINYLARKLNELDNLKKRYSKPYNEIFDSILEKLQLGISDLKDLSDLSDMGEKIKSILDNMKHERDALRKSPQNLGEYPSYIEDALKIIEPIVKELSMLEL